MSVKGYESRRDRRRVVPSHDEKAAEAAFGELARTGHHKIVAYKDRWSGHWSFESERHQKRGD